MATAPPLDIPAAGAGRAQADPAPEAAPRPTPRLRPNRLEWRGTVSADPQVRRSAGGIDFCVLTVSQQILDTQRQPATQAIDVVAFRERAHDIARRFRKGDVVEVFGELRIRHRRDERGAWHTNVSLYPTEEIALLGRTR
jgi:single-stranded DNA-binding protein